MCASLKEKLEAEFADKVSVTTNPVDSSDGKPKVYIIKLDGEPWFDWVMAGQDVKVNKGPNDKWQTPVNFETHEEYFGPHKAWQVEELIAAIKEKLG